MPQNLDLFVSSLKPLFKLITSVFISNLGGLFRVSLRGNWSGKLPPPLPPVLNLLELCQKLEISYVSTHTNAVSEIILFSIKAFLILLISAFF